MTTAPCRDGSARAARFVEPPSQARRAPPAGLLTALLRLLICWQWRARQRAHLERMDERMLRDIGIRREDAQLEARKPFWRP